MRFRGNWRGLSPPHAEDPGQVTGPPLPDNCVEHPNKGKLSSRRAENPRCQAQLRLNPRHSTGQVRGAARDPPFSERPPPRPRPRDGRSSGRSQAAPPQQKTCLACRRIFTPVTVYGRRDWRCPHWQGWQRQPSPGGLRGCDDIGHAIRTCPCTDLCIP